MFAQAYLWLSLSHVSFYEGLVPATGKGAMAWWVVGRWGVALSGCRLAFCLTVPSQLP